MLTILGAMLGLLSSECPERLALAILLDILLLLALLYLMHKHETVQKTTWRLS